MFKLPQEVILGIKDYRVALEEFLGEKINASRFTSIRVPWGVYSHRGKIVYMTRLRILAARIDAVQLKAIADAAKIFGQAKVHFTTRQAVQIHDIKLEDTIKVIEYLKDYDLSPRGGGGNTIRNITVCPLSGLCADEVFDVTAQAVGLTEFLLKQETSYTLPRKLKFSISGCSKDCTGCLVSDVGMQARLKDNEKGFKIFVGGGMGAEPLLGQLLEDFIPEEDLGYCVLSVKNVFYKNGDRRNKHHNRLRFLISDLGFDKFKELYKNEFKSLKDNEYINLNKPDISYPASCDDIFPEASDREFKSFLEYNVYLQKQKGLVSIGLRIPKGDITSRELEKLALVDKDFEGIEFRTTQDQNIIICNVRKSKTYDLFVRLKNIFKDFLYPFTLLDAVCCKGALTCNLGLCNSPGLSEQVERIVKDNFIGTPVFKKLNIKINGCPNACGHHPLGLISLHGMVRRVSGRLVPFYKLLLGGRKAGEFTRLAKDTGIIIAAKSVPLFLKDFIAEINKQITVDTDIYAFFDSKGIGLAKAVFEKYSHVPEYSENRDFYIDWGKTEEFSLEGLGPGECGAGVLDMIDADLADAKSNLDAALAGKFEVALLRKALFFSARALLVVKGSDQKTEEAVLLDFSKHFIETGIADQEFFNLNSVYESLTEKLTLEERKEKISYIKEFNEHISELYKRMDSAFNFSKQEIKSNDSAVNKPELLLDLKGSPCPINYVKSKLFLEELKVGEIVTILLDEGDPVKNVPKSLEGDGQKIINIEKRDGFYKVVVQKNV